MTEQSEAFEEWYAKQYPDTVPDYAVDEARVIKDNYLHVWQASEARILALLGSEEIENIVEKIIEEWGNASFQGEEHGIAKAALQAIKQKIGE